ncbi:dnaJ homolog subfamily C member 4-like [Stegodyphus dumicola]|uniref:dnaJ homolog subfamily C member 4-like n=1 Tax=Stegodyphus dumicola TaxID=202533 RepID=UPI0015ADD350|nr:dnaJ homolog subfamily C member 4-like [Stegodyphus dumicola]
MLIRIDVINRFRVFDVWTRNPNIYNTVLIKHYRTRYRRRSPYEILGLKNTCSTQDVKKAYIKLCKELHPDKKPGDTSQHTKFVELNNAYSTLVNVDNRKQYDEQYTARTSEAHDNFYWRHQRKASSPFKQAQGTWDHERPYYEREEYKEYIYRSKKKYPANITYRIKNIWIVMGCFVLVIIGLSLYYFAYSYATSYTLHKVDQRSKRISEQYNDTRKDALHIGKDEQVEKLRRKWNL